MKEKVDERKGVVGEEKEGSTCGRDLCLKRTHDKRGTDHRGDQAIRWGQIRITHKQINIRFRRKRRRRRRKKKVEEGNWERKRPSLPILLWKRK